MSMMRRFATVAFIVAAVGLGQSSNAQTGAAPQKPPQTGVCWINVETGKPVPNDDLVPQDAKFTDPEHAHANIVGPQGNVGSYVRGADGTWINTATGKPVPNDDIVPQDAKFTDPEHAHANIVGPQGTVGYYVRVPCPPPATTTPPATPGTTGMGFTPSFQLRGFGGATVINGNAPSTAGFDGAVLFPLGNRVLVGPMAGFQWVDSSIVKTIGGGPPPSTFINQSVGFKSGNFGGRIAFPFGGWQLGIHGGAAVASSRITQAQGFCGNGTPTGGPAGCTTTSSTTTHDTVVGPFVGGYISHSIFPHVGVFVGYDYHLLKDTKSSVSVFDLHDSDVVAGLVLSFGRHQVK